MNKSRMQFFIPRISLAIEEIDLHIMVSTLFVKEQRTEAIAERLK